jgi:hypothetical protein
VDKQDGGQASVKYPFFLFITQIAQHQQIHITIRKNNGPLHSYLQKHARDVKNY